MKKNIIFFLANYSQGGAGKSIENLCNSLNQKKYNIIIVCLNKCFYKKKFLKNNIKVFEINQKKLLFAQSEISKIIQDYAKKNEKTIFVSNLFYANALISLFQKKNDNIKFIFIERTPLQELSIYFGIKDFFVKQIIKIILKFNYKKADIIIANSKKTSLDIKKFSGCKTLYIYPPAYEKKNINRTIIKKNNILNILTAGRLSSEKNFEFLICALRNLKNIKFILRVVGDGPMKAKLKNLVFKLNMQNKVIFLGYKKNVIPFFNKSDLFISPSRFEGFPNVVVEAISAGLPVISSDSYGGIHEILKKKEFGMFYNNNDDHSLITKINYFINNRNFFFFNKSSVHKVFSRFSAQESCKEYEKVFDSL